MKIFTNCKIVSDGTVKEGYDIVVDKDKIIDVRPSSEVNGKKTDLGGNYIAAGFIELHCHGGGGYEFIDASPEAFKEICKIHAQHGTRVIYPTISATDYDTIVRVLRTAREIKNECDVEIPGVHLEGPYFSLEMCGAQAPGIVRDIDREEYESLLRNYSDIIARWDYAPEIDKNNAFLKALNEKGILPATAHSSAEYDDMIRAFSDGNHLVTHLYSCTSTITRHQGFRHLGIIESAYLLDDIYVEAIADGCHLPYELLKMIVKIKGADRVCLITDALRPAGIGENGKEYTDCPVPFVIEDGVAKLLDRSAFAGSIATSDVLLKTAVNAGIELADVVKMMTQTPAAVMGLNTKGKIEKGFDAQFTVFNENLQIVELNY
ncbi:MAG: amidohydrolase family protein [Acutalibacteraceae bacterium]|nr:amidohydrolase family protein [Acutalibacteraceae bacterium]